MIRNTLSLIAMLISAFGMGWCLFPSLVGQTFHEEDFRTLQFAFICISVPAFIIALYSYIIDERRVHRRRIEVLGNNYKTRFGQWPQRMKQIHESRLESLENNLKEGLDRWPQRLKYFSLFLLVGSVFSQGWVWIPWMIGQMFWEDYYGWMRLIVFIYSAPVFLLSLLGYIIAEKKIRRMDGSDAAQFE